MVYIQAKFEIEYKFVQGGGNKKRGERISVAAAATCIVLQTSRTKDCHMFEHLLHCTSNALASAFDQV
jgi:hypothetical protein